MARENIFRYCFINMDEDDYKLPEFELEWVLENEDVGFEPGRLSRRDCCGKEARRSTRDSTRGSTHGRAMHIGPSRNTSPSFAGGRSRYGNIDYTGIKGGRRRSVRCRSTAGDETDDTDIRSDERALMERHLEFLAQYKRTATLSAAGPVILYTNGLKRRRSYSVVDFVAYKSVLSDKEKCEIKKNSEARKAMADIRYKEWLEKKTEEANEKRAKEREERERRWGKTEGHRRTLKTGCRHLEGTCKAPYARNVGHQAEKIESKMTENTCQLSKDKKYKNRMTKWERRSEERATTEETQKEKLRIAAHQQYMSRMYMKAALDFVASEDRRVEERRRRRVEEERRRRRNEIAFREWCKVQNLRCCTEKRREVLLKHPDAVCCLETLGYIRDWIHFD